MSAKILGKNVTFKIEVEDYPKRILLVLDKKCEWAVVPWEDAFNLAKVMEQVIDEVGPTWPMCGIDIMMPYREQAQIKLNWSKGLVAIFVDSTDRVAFTTIEGFFLVMRGIQLAAQDAHLALRGTRLKYNKQGFLKEIHNVKAGFTQIIPGR